MIDLVASLYDFNDHAYRRFVEKLKVSHMRRGPTVPFVLDADNGRQDSLDPNGILSPGKQGIWPRRYRHHRDEVGKMKI